MRSVAVYCASSLGSDPRHATAAAELGSLLAARQIGIVYGGASVGLMGVLADAALAAGARVVGVIPRMLLDRELAHRGLAQLHITTTMQQRKTLMAKLSDGFIALPGGIGTLDELFEMWTWRQLGLHQKPFGLLNFHGYYDALLQFLDHAVANGFLRSEIRQLLVVERDLNALLNGLIARTHTGSSP